MDGSPAVAGMEYILGQFRGRLVALTLEHIALSSLIHPPSLHFLSTQIDSEFLGWKI